MDWQPVVSTFVTVFLTALAPVLASIATAWLVQQYKLARAKLSAEQLAALDMVAGFAVTAAEQAKAGGYISDKRAYALSVAETLLAQRGYTIDLDVIYAAIERAVYNEINRYKDPVAAPTDEG